MWTKEKQLDRMKNISRLIIRKEKDVTCVDSRAPQHLKNVQEDIEYSLGTKMYYFSFP